MFLMKYLMDAIKRSFVFLIFTNKPQFLIIFGTNELDLKKKVSCAFHLFL